MLKNDLILFSKNLINTVLKEKDNLKINGISIFIKNDSNKNYEEDYFLSGKIINLASYLACHSKNEEDINNLKSLIKFTYNLPLKTWGILNYLLGLIRLKGNNLLDSVLTKDELNFLNKKLHYNTFVDNNLNLINLPTNYYGVAFGVSKFREILNFENNNMSTKFLNKLLTHIKTYTNESYFMDETNGDGRYDRYSLLIACELCSHLLNGHTKIDEFIISMLKESSKVFLFLSNKDGNGFQYGRSIGAYGDTASGQVLSIAARLNILSDDEKNLAYSYNLNGLKKYLNFWIDKNMNQVNLRFKGRKTDKYRHLRRSLGESFSLTLQWFDILDNYDFCNNLKIININNEENMKFLKFKKNRASFFYKNNNYVLSLPMISGGNSYYSNPSYLPSFQSNLLFEPSPDVDIPMFYPYLIKDNKEYVFAHYIKSIDYNNNNINLVFNKYLEVGKKSINVSYSNELDIQYYIDNLLLEINYHVLNFEFEYAKIIFPLFEEIDSINDNIIYFKSNKYKALELINYKSIKLIDITNDDKFKTNHGTYKTYIEVLFSNNFGYKFHF